MIRLSFQFRSIAIRRRFEIIYRLAFVAGLLYLSVIPEALAWPPTHSFELNFTSFDLKKALLKRKMTRFSSNGRNDPGKEEQRAVEAFADALMAKCKDQCTKSLIPGESGSKNYRVTFHDDWYVDLTVDTAVVEIKLKPSTVLELKNQTNTLQAYVFDVARSLGMTEFETTSHYNFGADSAFGGDVKHFMSFFVDYANHPELSLGILGKEDILNAPPLTHLGDNQRQRLANLVRDVNAGKVTTIQNAVRRIESEVYSQTPKHKSPEAARHFQAFGMKYVDAPGFPEEDRPFELRAMRQPENATELAMIAELMEKRLEFTKKQPLLYQMQKSTWRRNLMKKMSKEEMTSRFYIYVAEAGLPWEPYNKLSRADLRYRRRDSFVMGSTDWRYLVEAKIAKRYAEDISTSEWVRKQMLTALARVDRETANQGMEVIRAIAETVRNNPSPEKTDRVRLFLEDARKVREWDLVRFDSVSEILRAVPVNKKCLGKGKKGGDHLFPPVFY